ncbi:hypothetical protein HPG69_001601 [Diceros bicornis minor]|uniref:Uncharacterized protein n=1 Tax=Diceros bicornis minor TaxID=77932 RepID=A0A7J7FGC3_DICBM|nr:hypothetical protein HPG69_001601 [Diceros bicornis minor]
MKSPGKLRKNLTTEMDLKPLKFVVILSVFLCSLLDQCVKTEFELQYNEGSEFEPQYNNNPQADQLIIF